MDDIRKSYMRKSRVITMRRLVSPWLVSALIVLTLKKSLILRSLLPIAKS